MISDARTTKPSELKELGCTRGAQLCSRAYESTPSPLQSKKVDFTEHGGE